ncbi:MAG: type II toxin-antitoxin system RelE/ParE family toxin [Gammaproteobacteria bacterium]|nr:MAG: type II toxin-antitoxin system RelE/ParE family toxin [Gammaproteobacteria bacterium]
MSASAHQIVIAPAAKDDLKLMYQYGLRQWGQERSDRYISEIKRLIWLLVEQPFMGTERPELLSNIRSLPIKSHILFYRIISTKVEIVRILHGRQDPHIHL